MMMNRLVRSFSALSLRVLQGATTRGQQRQTETLSSATATATAQMMTRSVSWWRAEVEGVTTMEVTAAGVAAEGGTATTATTTTTTTTKRLRTRRHLVRGE